MSVALRWTERAVAHLEALVDYIRLTLPVYAEGMITRIDQRKPFGVAQGIVRADRGRAT